MTKINRLREPTPEEVKVPKKSTSKVVRSLLNFISGSFLSKDFTLKFLPFVLYMTLIALCYIANGYYAENKVRQLNKLGNELKELRSEFIITKSDLMFLSKQSEVAKAALSMGLKESKEPPRKIVLRQDTNISKTDKPSGN
ncbi:MAG: FtsL-like putative cell division protein [Bacteroidia bacterium]